MAPSIVFPVIGAVSYHDTFGAPRGSGRTHAGQDMMAEKMQPLVAAADETISWITIPEASYGYMLTITDDAGWSYHYVHINNDTPGTDDGAADLEDVFAPGVERGAHVVAGQLVAYVGDSGNAEHVAPQLHFEIEDPSGQPVNPMAALDAATRLDAPVGSEKVADGVLPRIAGPD
ncbi:MAG: M23 family metallopeptidase, partial [Haloechinothrix sp.]